MAPRGGWKRWIRTLDMRDLARTVACPKCGAAPKAPCRGPEGEPRKSCHRERHQVVRPDYCEAPPHPRVASPTPEGDRDFHPGDFDEGGEA